MAGDRKFTRIPPESSGDRIKMKHTAVVPFDQKDTAHSWIIGGLYTIDGQSAATITAELLGYDQGGNAFTGLLYVRYDADNEYNNIDAEDDQNIKDPDGNIVAYVNGTPYATYINTTHIVGQNNPEYAVDVDRFGSMNIRFGEGQANLDAFGHLKIDGGRLVANYDFSRNPLEGQFANSIEGKGTKVYDPDIGAFRLTVDELGDRVTHTSNLFHPQTHGNANLYLMAARCGDAGSAGDGTVRFWGAFDSEDGYFFALVEDNLQVRHRFTLDGNATTDMIVNQSDWNKDTCDGSGGVSNPSGMNLDPSKINLYWMDYQFIGAGRARWGVFHEGERIVCHEMDGTNTEDHNAMSNPGRPVCWATAKPASLGPTTAGFKDFFVYGGAVYTEDSFDPLEHAFEQSYNNSSFELDHDSTSTTYMYTLRPQLTLPWSGKENHTIYAPTSLEVYPHNTRHQVLQLTNTSSDGTYWTITTDHHHYLLAGDKVEIFHAGDFEGRWLVYDTPTNMTFRIANTSTPINETHGMVKNMDTTYDEPHTELRIFAKCVMRGVSFSPVSYTAAEVDIYGDHLAHGPEIARFLAEERVLYSFDNLSNTLQYGAVYCTSDQSIARRHQDLELIQGDDDKYGTGVKRVRVTIRDNSHPIYGTTVHFFDDLGRVIFRADDGTENLTGFTTTHDLFTADNGLGSNDWYNLALLDRDEAWLYNSEADINDDRSVRVLECDVDPSAAIAVGDKISLGSATGPTASVKVIYQHNGGTWYIGLEGRGNDNAGGTTWSAATDALTNQDIYATGGADTNINAVAITLSSDRIGSWSGIGSGTWDEADERTTFDLDYETSLLAIDSSGWGTSTDSISNQNRIYGPPPVQPAWTFMARHLHETTHNTNIRTTMRWKERVQ